MTFAAVAASCAVIAGYQTVRLAQSKRVNASIANAMATTRVAASPPTAAAASVPATSANSSVPEARFAHALALAHSGQPEPALKAYKALAQGPRADLREAALYNIGNLHMREAARVGTDDESQSLPLIELAKQSYRDALRAMPGDWDARYNLERALRLAPEVDDPPPEDDSQEAPEEHVSSTLQGAKMDLP
jgi:mxaK protein